MYLDSSQTVVDFSIPLLDRLHISGTVSHAQPFYLVREYTLSLHGDRHGASESLHHIC